jgi:hypothetical protein
MLWVTRSHVHVDRVACPWLIKRFVDSQAEFVFVSASQVDVVAKKENAIPFDIPGCDLVITIRSAHLTPSLKSMT